MGNCFGTPKVEEKRAETWGQTGLVSLRDERLRAVPESVIRVAASAKVLDLGHNRLTFVPPLLFPQLRVLQRLTLSSNALTELPAEIGSCSQLRHLLLDSNHLTTLPEELCSCSKLEKLNVHSNYLQQLPARIGQLRELKSITCSSNKLGGLPESLGSCSALEELDASNNAIVVLPSSLAQLSRLRVLQLDGNQIRSLPEQLLGGCIALQSLSLHQNPITVEVLQALPGFNDYEKRRRGKFDKAIAGSAMLNSSGLDEGIDRRT